MDYLYLSAVVISGLMVNCGVMMVLRILSGRIVGALSAVLGTMLLVITVVTIPEQDDSALPRTTTTENPEIRTPIIDGLTVRVGPGWDYESATSIWQVYRGDKLRVVEDTLGWIRFHVRYFDSDWSGWVAKNYTTDWEMYEEMQRIERLHER